MKKSVLTVVLVVFVVLVVLTLVGFFAFNSFSKKTDHGQVTQVETTQNEQASVPSDDDLNNVTNTMQNDEEKKDAAELQITDDVIGTGTEAEAGDTVSLTYTGTLEDGTVFDASSRHGGEPLTFVLGSGRVIKGWDVGVEGMKVGGERTLVVPPELGYGERGFPGAIPPNATLTFEMKLVDVTKSEGGVG